MNWLLTLLILPLFSLTLKDSLLSGSPGDFIVYDQNRTFTTLVLSDVNANTLVIDEISLPSHKKHNESWRSWLEGGAKESSSWIRYRIDAKSEKVLESYSLSRECLLPLDGNDPLLATLMREPLITIPDTQRKCLNPKPGDIRRRLWHPPTFIDGEKKKREMSAYTAYWPNDSSELSSQPLDLYFDPAFPFPHWIELTARNFRVRAVDSGKNLKLPNKAIPPRNPKILSIKRVEDKVHLSIENPSHIEDFTLYLIQDKGGVKTPLACQIDSQEQKGNFLEIIAEAPNDPGEMNLIPDDFPHLSCEIHLD